MYERSNLNWWIWRAATDPRISDSLVTIQREWTVVDVIQANEALDVLLEVEHIRDSAAGR